MKRGKLLLVSFAGALVAAEVCVRLFVPLPERFEPPRTDPPDVRPFMQLESGLMVYRAGQRFDWIYDPAGDASGYFGPEGRVPVSINVLGFRGPEVDFDKPPGKRRVVCLGDSFTFGEGVRVEDAWPAQVGALLGDGYEVINAGVQGMGTPEEVAYFDSHCAILDPDVVVVGFFMNDVVDWQETIATQLERPAEPSPLASASRLFGLWERHQRATEARRRLLFDIQQGFHSERWEACVDALDNLKERAEREGFELLVAAFPVLVDLDATDPFAREHKLLFNTCEALGIECVQVHAAWAGHRDEDLWAHPTDMHPNAEAHRLAAELIAEALRSRRR